MKKNLAAAVAAMLCAMAAAQTEDAVVRAQALRAAGKDADAVSLLRQALGANPADGRARLELALALESLGDLPAARYHLELALGADLPAADKDTALITLRKIRELSTTTSLFVNTLAPVKSRPVVDPDGTSRTVRGESSYGLGVAASGRAAFGADRRWFLRGNLDARDYGGKLDDFVYTQGSGGRVFSAPRAAISVEAGALASLYQGRHWYSGALLQASETYYASPEVTWINTALVRRIEFTDLKGATANQGYLFSDVRWAWPGALTLGAGGTFGASRARDDWRGFNYGELRGSVLKELPRGWIVEFRVAGGLALYDAVEPGYTVERRDVSGFVAVDVTWRDWTVFRLAPRVTVARSQVGSNIDAYDTGRTTFGIGLTSSY